MDKFALGLIKWIVLPLGVGAFGYFVVGPKIGKSESESASASTKPGIQTTIPESAPAEDLVTPDVAKPSTESTPKVNSPATNDKIVGSKFDPDVPQGSASKASIGVDSDHEVGTDAVAVERAAKTISKPKPKRRAVAVAAKPKDTNEDGVVVFGGDKAKPKPKSTGGDSGPGDDIKKMKPKEHKPEKKDDPNLPATPEEPKDGGTTGGGKDGG